MLHFQCLLSIMVWQPDVVCEFIDKKIEDLFTQDENTKTIRWKQNTVIFVPAYNTITCHKMQIYLHGFVDLLLNKSVKNGGWRN